MKQINWGIIGCGDVTEKKSGPAFNKVENSKLVAVMRRDAAKAADYAQRHGVPKWYDNADKLINDADVNAIYIATPPDSHAYYTLKAFEAGKPVYVEKPMAHSYLDCTKMLEGQKKTGLPLFVAYYRRRLPVFIKVKELIEAGAIGDIRLVNMQLYWPPQPDDYNRDNLPWRVIKSIAGAGYFYDLAAHQFDILDYILGTITQAKGIPHNQARLYEVEDVVSASFKFESGVIGSGTWCFTIDEINNRDTIEITGKTGRLVFSTFSSTIMQLITEHGVQKFDLPNPENIQFNLIQTIVDDLLGKGICPSTGISGARANKVMDSVLGAFAE